MIFLDTGPLVGRYNRADQHYGEATAGFEAIRRQGTRLWTSNFVLDEALTLIARRSHGAHAASIGRQLYSLPILTVLRPDETDERNALDDLHRFAIQGIGFTDCVSFALMRRHRIRAAFTFDRHYEDAGFTRWGC